MEDEPQLTAKGIDSRVMKGGSYEETVGHVLLVDWDDWEMNDRVAELIDDYPGISLLLESSDGSRHMWNLSIRGLDETALELLTLKSDPMRTMMGYRWRPPRWVTRFTPKTFDDGEVYKPAPKLIAVQYEPTTLQQSKAHWNIARAYIDGFPEEIPTEVNWYEGSTKAHEYRTYTDEQKEAME